MENKNKTAKTIRLIARIWGSVSLGFLVFMVGAHVVASATGKGDPIGNFNSTSELVSFLFFPIFTIIGLSLAWKWEGLGGLVVVVGIIGFHVIRPDLIFNFMIDGLAFPGLLFLIYWYLAKEHKTIRN